MEQETKKPIRSTAKSDTARMSRIDRQRKVIDLRTRGYGYREIAAALKKQAETEGLSTRGFSHEQMRRDYKSAMQMRIDELAHDVDEYRALTMARLERTLQDCDRYEHLKIDDLTSDNLLKAKFKAMDVKIKAIREIVDVLGLRRPQKIALTDTDGNDSPLTTKVIVQFTDDVIKNDDPEPAAMEDVYPEKEV